MLRSRTAAIAFAAAVLLLGTLSVTPDRPAAAAAPPPTAAEQAIRALGLRVPTDGSCPGMFRVSGTDMCTHGSDGSAPHRPASGRLSTSPPADTNGTSTDASADCEGGSTGKRIQAIYARSVSRTDRYATILPSIRAYAGGVDGIFQASAAETGGSLIPRWTRTASCEISVANVVLSDQAETDFGATIRELKAQGFDDTSRKYHVWYDTPLTGICGIATLFADDQAGTGNVNNNRSGYARTDRGCWDGVEAHEIMHNLGAVQDSAPHSTALQGSGGHCSDGYDVMCYEDAPGVVLSYPCADPARWLFDCGHDDYFHTDPPAGTYLATHWNAADSGWLAAEALVTDTDPPLVTAPALAFPRGGTVAETGTARIPLRATWTATDSGSGVSTTSLQRSADGGGSFGAVALPSAASTNMDLLLGPSSTSLNLLRDRATDVTGNTSAWATGPGFRVRAYQETAAAPTVTFSGTWSTGSASSAYGGALRYASTGGRSAFFTFTGTDVALVSTKSSNRGQAAVFIDGVKVDAQPTTTAIDPLDLYASARTFRRVVFSAHFDTAGTHTVEIRVLGTRNASSTGSRVDIDAWLAMTP